MEVCVETVTIGMELSVEVKIESNLLEAVMFRCIISYSKVLMTVLFVVRIMYIY